MFVSYFFFYFVDFEDLIQVLGKGFFLFIELFFGFYQIRYFNISLKRIKLLIFLEELYWY